MQQTYTDALFVIANSRTFSKQDVERSLERVELETRSRFKEDDRGAKTYAEGWGWFAAKDELQKRGMPTPKKVVEVEDYDEEEDY